MIGALTWSELFANITMPCNISFHEHLKNNVSIGLSLLPMPCVATGSATMHYPAVRLDKVMMPR